MFIRALLYKVIINVYIFIRSLLYSFIPLSHNYKIGLSKLSSIALISIKSLLIKAQPPKLNYNNSNYYNNCA
jgi:hypothetical protein